MKTLISNNNSLKSKTRWPGLMLAGSAVVAAILWCKSAYAPPIQPLSLTISPAIITNDYKGVISLSIGNLAFGHSVIVERYADLNSNGVVDAGEPLLLWFTNRDFAEPLVAGVRNPNVPGDDDGAFIFNGQILAKLPFPWVDGAVFPAAIRSVFQVTDPTLPGSTGTQTFTVVQKKYAQGVSGRVTLAPGGLPMAHTLVALASANLPTTGVMETDTNGFYTFYCLPGTYAVVVAAPGIISDESQQVTVACDQFVTNNVAVTTNSLVITGHVTDSASGAGLAGINVSANSTNNLFSIAFTDTNGAYTLAATTNNTWKARPDKRGPAQLGYLGQANRQTEVLGILNVANVNFAMPNATALISGTVTDQQGVPVIGASITAQNGSSPQLEADAVSYATNGLYALGVTNGNWTISLDSGQLALWGMTGQSTNVTISDGATATVNLLVTRTNFPSLLNPFLPVANQSSFLLSGLPALTYYIDYSTNLSTSNWFMLLSTNGDCGPVTIADPAATNSFRFYRARIAP